MFVVTLLFGPGSGLQAVAWPAVFSCSLGVPCLPVLGNLLYSAFLVAWLVYRFLLGFSFPPFPPSSVTLLLFQIGVGGWFGLGLFRCLMYLLFFH